MSVPAASAAAGRGCVSPIGTPAGPPDPTGPAFPAHSCGGSSHDQPTANERARLARAVKVMELGGGIDGTRADWFWRVREERLYRITHPNFEKWCEDHTDFTKRWCDELASLGQFRDLVCRPLGTAVPNSDWAVRKLVGRPLEQQEEVVRYLIAQHNGELKKFVKAEVDDAIDQLFFLQVQDQKPARRRKRGKTLPPEDRRVIIKIGGKPTVIDVDECDLPDLLAEMADIARKIASYGEPAIPMWKRAASEEKRQPATKDALDILYVTGQFLQNFDPEIDGDPQAQMGPILPRGAADLDPVVNELLSPVARLALGPGELPDAEGSG